MSVTDAGAGNQTGPAENLRLRHWFPGCPGCVQIGIKWNYAWFTFPMASFPPCASRPGDSALVAHGCLGPRGAIDRRARCEHTLFDDLQFHGFQAEDAKDTTQETQTCPSREPSGKSGAYGAN